MTDRKPAGPKTAADVIAATMGTYGMRLPPQHDRAGIDERVELFQLVAQHVERELRRQGFLT